MKNTIEDTTSARIRKTGSQIYALVGKMRTLILLYSQLKPGEEFSPTTQGLIKVIGQLYDLILLVQDEIKQREIDQLED